MGNRELSVVMGESNRRLLTPLAGGTVQVQDYRMPFAWSACRLFGSANELDATAQFTPLFRQEQERLTQDDLVKMLGSCAREGGPCRGTVCGDVSFHRAQ